LILYDFEVLIVKNVKYSCAMSECIEIGGIWPVFWRFGFGS
jgi:hypothetical protein